MMDSAFKEGRLAEIRPYVERARQMRGWVFDIKPARIGPETPWTYGVIARELLANARSVLDMGTGGGERFSRLCKGYQGLAVATEGWSGNVRVADDRLGPMRVQVVFASILHLPFIGDAFDLVLNRHEELAPADVARVLGQAATS